MPTVIKTRIDLLLHANATQIHLLVRNLEIHRPRAVAFAVFEAPLVDIARPAIDHAALAVGFVVFPFPLVGVAVGVFHFAHTGLDAENIATSVEIASEANFRA